LMLLLNKRFVPLTGAACAYNAPPQVPPQE
jgi:hypothetical protein